MSLGPTLVMNTIGESTEGLFLTSSSPPPTPRIGLQISRLPVQLGNKPTRLTEGRYIGEQARASCVLSQMGFPKEPLSGRSPKPGIIC